MGLENDPAVGLILGIFFSIVGGGWILTDRLFLKDEGMLTGFGIIILGLGAATIVVSTRTLIWG